MKLERAVRISVFGAGILGFGLGAFFSGFVQQYAAWIILAGIAIHGYGMYRANAKKQNRLDNVLYWACWAIIICFLAYIALRIL